MKDFSVIVSTYSKDKFNLVLSCIDSIRKQAFSPTEIILVLDPEREILPHLLMQKE